MCGQRAMNLVPANYTAATATEPAALAQARDLQKQAIGTRSSWSMNSSSSGSGASHNNNTSYLHRRARPQQFTVSTGEQPGDSLEKTFYERKETRAEGATSDPIQGGECNKCTPFKNLPIYLNNSNNSFFSSCSWNCASTAAADSKNNKNHMNFIKHDDRRKELELRVIQLVEQSTLAAEEAKPELALARAKEASEGLNTLKTTLMQDKSGKSHSTNRMMTRGVSLFELSIMVESNLASQMRNNEQLEESIGLYTQLCRLAGSVAGANPQLTAAGISMVSSSANQHGVDQYDAKFLLYRFGIDIGNVYYELGEYQRALKYYRLTLDRLSSTGYHHRNLKIKLMNNISITLLTAEQYTDAISSLNLLLADNLSLAKHPHQLQQQQQRQKQQHSQDDKEVDLVDVCNSNHHRFGLNLMLCHHQRSDLKSMMVTFASLVKVNICHHYLRVPAAEVNLDNKMMQLASDGPVMNPPARQQAPRASASSGRNGYSSRVRDGPMMKTGDESTMLATTTARLTQLVGATLDTNEINVAQLDTMMMQKGNDESGSTCTNSTFNEHDLEYDRQSASIRAQQQVDNPSTKSEQLTELSGGDDVDDGNRLETMICEKLMQIYRCLTMSCNLMVDLDNRLAEIDDKLVKGNSRSHSYAFEYCSEILERSEIYKSIVCNLKSCRVVEMVEKKHGLDAAIAELSSIVSEMRPSQGDTKVKMPIRRSATDSKEFFQSSLVAGYSLLYHFLRSDINTAQDYGNTALKLDKSNVQTLTNLGNCHYLLQDLTAAEMFYQRALMQDPSCWEANHNLVLVFRRVGRSFDDLPQTTKSFLNNTKQSYSSLVSQRMILPIIHLVLM